MTGNERKKLSETVADRLEVSGYVGSGVFRITVTGNRQLHVENHRGILEYGSERIKINCGRTVVAVIGADLEVRAINARELLIGGEICSISLDR